MARGSLRRFRTSSSSSDLLPLHSRSIAMSTQRKPSGVGRVMQAARRPLRSVGRLVRGHTNRNGAIDGALRYHREGSGNNAGYGTLGSDEMKEDSSHSGGGAAGGGTLVENAASTLRDSLRDSLRVMANVVKNSPSERSESTVAHTRVPTTAEGREWVVFQLERVLRNVVLWMLAYLIGVYRPDWGPYFERGVEYMGVAWTTCIVIIVLAWFEPQSVDMPTPTRPEVFVEEEMPLMNGDPSTTSKRETTRKDLEDVEPVEDTVTVDKNLETEEVQNRAMMLDEEDADPGSNRSLVVVEERVATGRRMTPHPSLEAFYVIDTATGERIIPNLQEPHQMETDYFTGAMMFLIRTPDADDPTAEQGTEDSRRVSEHMRGKQRRFEFQFQLKLKKRPEGRVYFACELDEAVKIGIVQRAFVGAAMAFVKATNSTFHYCMSGGKKEADGRYEKPHMAFTVDGSMDRVVVTKPGEQPPRLGDVIHEDSDSLKRRKKGGTIDWNTDDTYTFALWTAYVDFLEWKCLNLPGIRPFKISSVIGPQHMNLSVYVMPDSRGNDKHYRRDMSMVSSLELCNVQKMNVGPFSRSWIEKNQSPEAAASVDDDDDDRSNPRIVESSLELTQAQMQQDEGNADAEDEEDEDEATLAELGEGMYLRSGDRVVLSEFVQDVDEVSLSYVSIGDGFVILQNQAPPTIIIEKVAPPPSTLRELRASLTKGSRLIKNGDTVTMKLVTKGRHGEEGETKYLSIHRGWWLKWVDVAPTKNGFFTIHTHEPEFDDVGGPETHSSYLTLGASFRLRHKRWSNYQVGVSAEESPSYGGRILGLLHLSGGQGEDNYASDDGENVRIDNKEQDVNDKRKGAWMRPLQLCAQESCTSTPLSPSAATKDQTREEGKTDAGNLVANHAHLDVPAWIEMMNRTQRIRHLAYVVRVRPEGSNECAIRPTAEEDTEGCSRDNTTAYSRLRTGRDLDQIMRLGLSLGNDTSQVNRRRKNSADSTPRSAPQSPTNGTGGEAVLVVDDSGHASAGTTIRNNQTSPVDELKEFTFENDAGVESGGDPIRDDDSHGDWDMGGSFEEEEEEFSSVTGVEGDDVETSNGRPRKRFIGKIAKTVKTGTTATGKTVVKQGKKVRKGTINAGKAIIEPFARSKNPPPLKEPKRRKAPIPGKNINIRRQERDLHAAVKKTIKSLDRKDSRNLLLSHPPDFLAGELSAPEQSCRKASHILSKLSELPPSSHLSVKLTGIVSSQIACESEQDTWFLRGGPAQVGVVPAKDDNSKGRLLHGCLAARCLWESHWREEWCGVYERSLSFYAPLTKEPCLELSFTDIQYVRALDAGSSSPLAGFPLLVLETAWLCHYIAFPDQGSRLLFQNQISSGVLAAPKGDLVAAGESDRALGNEKELLKAHFWQGFQEFSMSSGRGKWAKVASSAKMKHRTILNARRMVFDLPVVHGSDANKFVEDLLSTSLSFSVDSLEKDPTAFINFLDSTSQLHCLPLQDINRSDSNAYCLFVNLYHCLLQHAMLLSVKGPLQRRSVGHFMRTSCYEIGGDVFSLAELNSCIIRGRMSRAVNPKPPYVEPSRKSHAYRYYSLDFRDPRTNFVLNTADVSCPQEVPVLKPSALDAQLTRAACDFLRRQLSVENTKKTVILPKVCDVYRWDFVGSESSPAKNCLRYCMRFLDDSTSLTDQRSLLLSTLLADDDPRTIKYQSSADQYHSGLKLKDEI